MKEKVKYSTLALLVGLVIGFFVGRQKIVLNETVRFVKGETIRDTITIHTPVKEVWTTDTLYLIERDTVKTLVDFNLYRTYQETIINEYGKIDFTAGIQYNKLQDFSYSQTPIQKEVTRTVLPVWQPYIGVNYNTLNQASLSVGVFYHNIAFEMVYLRDFKNGVDDFGGGIKVKW